MNPLVTILQKLPVIVLLLLGAVCVAAGDFFGKSWSLDQRNTLYFVSLAAYALSAVFYLPSLLKEGLVITTVIWSILIILVSVFIGLVLFRETLSPLRMIGVLIGLVSLVILNIAK